MESQAETFFTRKSLCSDTRSDTKHDASFINKLRWRQEEKEVHVDDRSLGPLLQLNSIFHVLEAAEDIDRVNIASALLDQRKSIPLYWVRKDNISDHQFPSSSENASTTCPKNMYDFFPLLSFLKARLQKPKDICDLGTNEHLPRVALFDQPDAIGTTAADMSNEVFHTHFHRYFSHELELCVEMSVGFAEEEDNHNDEPSYKPCLVFLIRGDPKILPEYFFDIFTSGLILISSSDVHTSSEVLGKLITCSEEKLCLTLQNIGEEETSWYGPNEDLDEEELPSQINDWSIDFFQQWENTKWKSFNDIISEASNKTDENIRNSELQPTFQRSRQTELFRIFSSHSVPAQILRTSTREKLRLQLLFNEEEKLIKKERHLSKRSKQKQDLISVRRELASLREVRRPLEAETVLQEPVMNMFLSILQLPNRSQRLLNLHKIGNAFNRAAEENTEIQKANVEIEALYEEENKPNIKNSRKQAIEARLQKLYNITYMNKIDIPCLFREMGCIYTALLNEKVRHFPHLAAQHLLDGGIIEFMDGDSAKVNTPWVNAILLALNEKFRLLLNGAEPKFSVRSVFGVQSCGKSTVLNTMFGCQLTTSAGTCTRGINMFLVPCDRPDSPFNAILGLDTEGVCSPEQRRSDASETSLINNRMALFCVLMADAGLCISTTETNDLFRDTLGIVMAVYNAVELSSLSTRLFFLYNKATSVNDINGAEMERVQNRVFKEALDEGWKLASNQGGVSDGNNAPDFVNLLDKSKDIERVQQRNRSDSAPNDVPDPEFGKALSLFNDHIHQSLSKLRGSSGTRIAEIIQRLEDLEFALELGQFYLTFPDMMRYRQQEKEEAAFQKCVQKSSRTTFDIFMKMKGDMTGELESMDINSLQGIEWDDSKWQKDIQEAVTNSFQEQFPEMQKEMAIAIGESLYSQKFPQYEEKWNKTIELDYEGKNIELRKKWKAVIKIASDLRQIKDILFKKLTDGAVEVRDNLLKESRELDGGSLRHNRFILDRFKHIFEEECRAALEGDRNISVFEPIMDVIYHIKPEIAVTNESEWKWMEGDWEHPDSEEKGKTRGKKKGHHRRRRQGTNIEEQKQQKQLEIYNRAKSEANDAADEFSKHVPERIFQWVNREISRWGKDRRQAQFSDLSRIEIFKHVVKLIGPILQAKQTIHHETNSLYAQMVKSRDEMFEFFLIQIIANVGADELTSMLKQELQKCFEQSLIEYQVRYVRSKLGSFAWLGNIQSALALVDLQILSMFKDGQRFRAISAAGSADFFLETIRAEIEKNINNEQIFKDILVDIRLSIQEAVKEMMCTHNESAGSVTLINCLEKMKGNAQRRGLTVDITTSLKLAATKSSEINTFMGKEGASAVSKMLDKVSKELCIPSQIPIPNGKVVHEALGSALRTEISMQPRCGVPCPTCSMPCMKERNHIEKTGNDKLHSCTHQPQGLACIVDVSTNCLSWESCVDAKRLGLRYIFNETPTPYSEFRSMFPEWEDLPVKQQGSEIREFLFYNCQEELMKRFPGTRRCSNLDETNYGNHRLEKLIVDAEVLAYGSQSERN